VSFLLGRGSGNALLALELGDLCAGRLRSVHCGCVRDLIRLCRNHKADGSSTVYPITDYIAAEFQKLKKNAVNVTVDISGTTGGFRKFCRGEIDISGASRPINTGEMADCRTDGVEFIELPVAFDALTVVVNPRNKFLTSISVEELRKLWAPEAQARVKSWRQVNADWPDEPIRLFGPGNDSGTFDYFTEAIVGKARSSRRDYTASEDDNVLVQGVARDVHALGYFGFAYYVANKGKLRALSIAPETGATAVEPSLETVNSGRYRPLSRPIFIYISVKSLAREEVREFAESYLKSAAQAARAVNYIPLPASAYLSALERLRQMKKGSVFQGSAEIGMTVEELLRRETKR
jgi:phosphate transport system substrate-binding protein